MSTAHAPAGLLLAGLLSAASAQAVTAQAGATVIAPVSVISPWADLPVTVSVSGGWVRLVIAPARPQPLGSSPSHPLNEADLAVAVSSAGSTTLLREARATDWRSAIEGILNAEFTTSLSTLAALDGGRYSVTVGFN